MGKFFKDNWLYILLPILLVAAAVIALLLMGDGDNGGTFSGYEI